VKGVTTAPAASGGGCIIGIRISYVLACEVFVRLSLLPVLAVVAGSLLLSACDDAASTPTPDASDRSGNLGSEWTRTESASYRIEGSMILIDHGVELHDTDRYCVSRPSTNPPDSLVVYPMVLKRLDTLYPRLRGDTLELWWNKNDGPEYTMFVIAVLVRLTGAGGVEGSWRLVEYRERNQGQWYHRWRVVAATAIETRLVMDGRSYVWAQRPLVSWADYQILSWNQSGWDESLPSDSSRYDVQVAKIDDEAVKYTGKRTGESVVARRIRVSTRHIASGDVSYSSSDPTHASFVRKERIESCPDMLPWYRAFLDSNARPLAARVALAGSSSPSIPSFRVPRF